jgi:hypothetical protein
MRMAAVLALIAVIALPTLAAAGGRNECRRLTRQLENFEAMHQRARERNRPMWEEGMYAQVERLKTHRAAECPEYAEERAAELEEREGAAAFVALVKTAAQAAVKYFTMGAF